MKNSTLLGLIIIGTLGLGLAVTAVASFTDLGLFSKDTVDSSLSASSSREKTESKSTNKKESIGSEESKESKDSQSSASESQSSEKQTSEKTETESQESESKETGNKEAKKETPNSDEATTDSVAPVETGAGYESIPEETDDVNSMFNVESPPDMPVDSTVPEEETAEDGKQAAVSGQSKINATNQESAQDTLLAAGSSSAKTKIQSTTTPIYVTDTFPQTGETQINNRLSLIGIVVTVLAFFSLYLKKRNV
ncbi:LPXTG cell wall anchor domain-containing protein [Carnobacterium gallinarum]|uniref:LPXTG cell wall anchor domain-containing protein n=1 Tax=Carnobacterium gallinarum TaxID=2749 RepID=UPI000690F9A7|nr:LPXTG cell wall anchor domain-containing protein [Carnobacterium gallinarum]